MMTTVKNKAVKKKTITKKKLIQMIALTEGCQFNMAKKVLQAFLDLATKSLAAGDRLELRDFGVFESVSRKSKIGRNPKNPIVPIVIPERLVVKFTPGKKMRKEVKELHTSRQN